MKGWATLIQNVKLNAHVHDILSVPQYIRQFNDKESTNLPEKDIRATNPIFGVLETIKVNNLQMACAQIIYNLTASFKHQLHIIPGGYGKSCC